MQFFFSYIHKWTVIICTIKEIYIEGFLSQVPLFNAKLWNLINLHYRMIISKNSMLFWTKSVYLKTNLVTYTFCLESQLPHFPVLLFWYYLAYIFVSAFIFKWKLLLFYFVEHMKQLKVPKVAKYDKYFQKHSK